MTLGLFSIFAAEGFVIIASSFVLFVGLEGRVTSSDEGTAAGASEGEALLSTFGDCKGLAIAVGGTWTDGIVVESPFSLLTVISFCSFFFRTRGGLFASARSSVFDNSFNEILTRFLVLL